MKIVVGVKFNEEIKWYRTEDLVWHLDLTNFEADFLSPEIKALRMQYKVLTKQNFARFLNDLQDYEVSLDLLKNKFQNKKIGAPELIIDVDNCIFYDNFPEPNNYSSTLPDDWEYSYEDLDEVVDKENQYWN